MKGRGGVEESYTLCHGCAGRVRVGLLLQGTGLIVSPWEICLICPASKGLKRKRPFLMRMRRFGCGMVYVWMSVTYLPQEGLHVIYQGSSSGLGDNL